ncbi:MAG: PQQ-binding-like beta-propeller repeat protein [Elusimicrobiota bacterium]
MKKKLFKIFLVLGMLFSPVSSSFAESSDWPMFLGNKSRTSSSRQWAMLPLEGEWEYDMYDDAVASPVISDEILYTASRSGAIYAFDISSGEVKWQTSLGSWVDSTPAIENNTVYAFTKEGVFYSLDATDGNIKWSVDLECDGVSSPVITEKGIYVGRGTPKNDIVRLTTEGTLTLDIFTPGQPVWSSPLYYNGYIYSAANDGSVYKLDENLDKVWKYSTETGIFRLSSVSVWDGILYFAPGDTIRKIYALDTDKSVSAKSPELNTGGEGVYTSSVASDEDENLYVVMSSTVQVLYCLDALTLELNWKKELAQSRDNQYQPTPAVTDGAVYTGTENGQIKSFYTYKNAEEGVEPGDRMISLEVDSSTTEIVNSPAVSDGYVAAVSGSGEISVWKAGNAASIVTPKRDDVVSGSSNVIRGTARAYPEFEEYNLSYGSGEDPSAWNEIFTSTVQIDSGVLDNWNVSSLEDGVWSLKLTVQETSKSGKALTTVNVDNPPGPVSDLKAETVKGGSAQLSWEKSSDDGAGNDDVEGYNIYRAETSTATFDYSTPLDSKSAGEESFYDDELDPFTTYYYTVRSFDSHSESKNSEISSVYIDDSFVWFDISAKDGGTAQLPGGTKVYFPPEILKQDSRVKIERMRGDNIPEGDTLSPWMPTSLAWRFSIDPDQKFKSSARMELVYGENDISGMTEELLRIYWYDVQDSKWRMVDTSEAVPSENKVRAKVNRFSYYRLGQHVGGEEIITEENVYTYPNPAPGNEATFKFLIEREAEIEIKVFNVAGEAVKSFKETYSSEEIGKWQEIEWDISNIASGVYVYRIKASGDDRDDEVVKKLAIVK